MKYADYHARKIPEYYDGMHLDGFEPWQIQVASRKTLIRELHERELQRRIQQLEHELEEAKAEIQNIKITSEIKTK